MKNENDMDILLSKYGFEESDEPNTWLKDEWEVRIYGTLIEISEDPIKVKRPRYYSADMKFIDMATLLEEISN